MSDRSPRSEVGILPYDADAEVWKRLYEKSVSDRAELRDHMRRVLMWLSPHDGWDEDTALVESRRILREALGDA